MYVTTPVTSATSERTFSALRRLKNYQRSTMKQDRLKIMIYLLMHCHKSIRDTLDTVKGQTLWRLLVPMNIAKGILENLSRGMRMANWEMSALPPLLSPHVQKAPPSQEWRAERFVKELASIGKRTTTTTTVTRAGKTIGFMSKKNITARPSHAHFVSTILRRPQHDYDKKPVPMQRLVEDVIETRRWIFLSNFWTCLDRAHEI